MSAAATSGSPAVPTSRLASRSPTARREHCATARRTRCGRSCARSTPGTGSPRTWSCPHRRCRPSRRASRAHAGRANERHRSMTRSLIRDFARFALIAMLAAGAGAYWLLDAPFDALRSHTHSTGQSALHAAATTSATRTRTGDGGHHSRPHPPRPASSPSTLRPANAIRADAIRRPAGAATPASATAKPGFGTRLVHWLLIAPVLGAAVALAALCGWLGFLPARLRARAGRAAARERHEIIPYRNDVATPERMAQVFQALAATLNRRWFRRILTGAPSVAFEVHVLPQQQRPARVVLSVVCAPEDALLIDSCLQIAYPDVRVGSTFAVDL